MKSAFNRGPVRRDKTLAGHPDFFIQTPWPEAPPEAALYVDIALPIPQEEPYQYAVPAEFAGEVSLGKRVRVPLRERELVGYVVGITEKPSVPGIKSIRQVIDPEAVAGPALLDLTRWISGYYGCSWGQALQAALPAPFKKGVTRMKCRAKKKEPEERVHASPPWELTADQRKVLDALWKPAESGQYAEFLLHGVTGSGKTEIYLQLIERVLAAGRGAIVLVPEISLTPQITERFQERFGDRVAVVHSRLSPSERLEEWHRLRTGQATIAVGARSAVFGPVVNLGLIVMDEEHDDSYKQDETPRYETSRVAAERCRLEGAVLLKASATPSLESYQKAMEHPGSLLELPMRIFEQPLPPITVVDMKKEKAGSQIRIFSIELENAIRDAVARKAQVMLLLNRRGYAPYILCVKCGKNAECPQCRVSLVFHRARHKLVCHWCFHAEPVPPSCGSCGGPVRFLGLGTERVEAEALRLFPQARIARMDKDATSKKNAHEILLRAFRKNEIDILLGTQMIAKGHDFPGVQVVGVISADTALHLADFRAAERTFSLITQVAGRAGRQDSAGQVFVQTHLPQHYAIQAARLHDYRAFFDKETVYRKELGLPPFSSLVQVIFSGKIEARVYRRALELRKHLETDAAQTQQADPNSLWELMGPAPCLISRKGGDYLWNLFIKTHDIAAVHRAIRRAEKGKSKDVAGVALTVDVNPR